MFIGGVNVDIWIHTTVGIAIYFREHGTAGSLPVVSRDEA